MVGVLVSVKYARNGGPFSHDSASPFDLQYDQEFRKNSLIFENSILPFQQG